MLLETTVFKSVCKIDMKHGRRPFSPPILFQIPCIEPAGFRGRTTFLFPLPPTGYECKNDCNCPQLPIICSHGPLLFFRWTHCMHGVPCALMSAGVVRLWDSMARLLTKSCEGPTSRTKNTHQLDHRAMETTLDVVKLFHFLLTHVAFCLPCHLNMKLLVLEKLSFVARNMLIQ